MQFAVALSSEDFFEPMCLSSLFVKGTTPSSSDGHASVLSFPEPCAKT